MDKGDRVLAGVLVVIAMLHWMVAMKTGDLFAVLCGSALLLMAGRLLGQGGSRGSGGSGDGDGVVCAGPEVEPWCVGRWTKLGASGVDEVEVRWDPVIGHYLVNGEAWTDDEGLSGFLAWCEQDGAGAPWVPADDEHTQMIRRALGLAEVWS